MELLAGEGRELSLTEISKVVGWPKSTVHGLLATLRDYHYIEQSPVNGRYRLGIRLFELCSAVARSWNIRTVALPVMQQLNRELGEMVQLATEDKGEVLYLEKLDSTHMMRIVSETGMRLPMHCSGLGKALLAYKTPAEVKWIIGKRGLQRFTRRTIADAACLERELEQVRRRGYAVDDREVMDSLRCVAAPIRDRDGCVKYAVSVSGLASSLEGAHLERALEALKQTAENISFAMGYRMPGE
jgi:DNA-binding IclR family transcriptional regulator